MQSNDIKDKQPLLDNRKLIETVRPSSSSPRACMLIAMLSIYSKWSASRHAKRR
jgi:CCR4-NOT transcriptional regulation complex NOT5 subunit